VMNNVDLYLNVSMSWWDVMVFSERVSFMHFWVSFYLSRGWDGRIYDKRVSVSAST
jgi:hypothetical protein